LLGYSSLGLGRPR